MMPGVNWNRQPAIMPHYVLWKASICARCIRALTRVSASCQVVDNLLELIGIYEKWGEGGTSVQDRHATQCIVIIKCNESRSGTLRNCNLKSLDDDVMRIDEAMMRAADINMRADDG